MIGNMKENRRIGNLSGPTGLCAATAIPAHQLNPLWKVKPFEEAGLRFPLNPLAKKSGADGIRTRDLRIDSPAC